MRERRRILARALGRGFFPYQLAWVLDNPIRRLLITPERLADRLHLDDRSYVLELGPGSGYFSVELARRTKGGHLELLDLQPEMLAMAKRKLDRAGMQHVSYTAADASDELPYPAETFDTAVLVAVLGEVSDRDSTLRGLLRVLRQGGVLAVHEHLPDPDRIPFHTLRPFVESRGFSFEERWGPAWNYTAIFRRPFVSEGPSNKR